MRHLRRAASGAYALVVLAVVLPSVVVSELLRRGSGMGVAQALVRALAPIGGLRFEVRGLDQLEPGRSYVFTPNHSSPLDIPAMLLTDRRIGFAAATELYRYPVLRTAMRAARTVPIERSTPADTRRALIEAARALEPGSHLVIFPEGGMAGDGELLEFKTGPFVFAITAGAPVVPVAIHNASRLMPRRHKLVFSPGRIVVEILEPIPTEGLTLEDRHVVRDRARGALASALRPEDGGSAARSDLGDL